MLRQSARKRALDTYLRHSSSHLYLPWLCPASQTASRHHARRSQTLARPTASPRKSLPTLSRQPPTRELASAASDSFYPSDDQYVPFNASANDFSDAFAANLFANPPLYDASRLLMLENPLPLEPIRLRRGARSEIGGLGIEIEATFGACLHVGRFDRAEGLVERLADIYSNDSEELIAINHRYMRGITRSLELNRKEEDYKRLTKWADKGLKKLQLEKDGLVYATLLRSAFVFLEGPARDRAIQKYWKAVQLNHLEAGVIGAAILTDADYGLLSEICPSEIQDFTEQFEPVQDSEQELALESDINVNPITDVASAPIDSSGPVRPVSQRGVGLKYLKESMTSLVTSSHAIETSMPWQSPEDLEALKLEERQEQLEMNAIDSALRRWREEQTAMEHHQDSSKLGFFLWEWQKLLTEKIEEELNLLDEAERRKRKTQQDQERLDYGPFLRLVSKDRLSALTIITVLSLMAKTQNTTDMKISNIMVHIGKAVHMEAMLASVTKSKHPQQSRHDKALSKYIETTSKNEGAHALWRIERRLRKENKTAQPNLTLSGIMWSNVTYAKVGGVLTSLMAEAAKVKVTVDDPDTGKQITAHQPAFVRSYKFELGKRIGFLTMHESVATRLRRDPNPAFVVKHLPMLCPPKPWKGFMEGGYLKTNMPVIRVKNAVDRQRRYIEVAADEGDLKNFFAGLDILGRTSWKINQDVYNVMLEAWNSGQAVANLAPAEYIEPPPEKPADWSDMSARRRWYMALRAHENTKTGLHSERCFQNLQMEMAQNYLNETFYLPHNADFRGRAYPLAPYLNQMGADNARGLLLFGEGRALGEEGLRWLKIHLANVFGYDKASFTDRELFAMDHLDDIRDSVEKPFDGRRWWLKAEDPWQCLATCFELQHAFDSPNPLEYVSHLPVHQDGSCNGLQHYAALGGDKAGAQQVNLEPGDKPSDVYTGVAELIKAEITKEAAEGRKIARVLQGKVTRKIVKQTVMTNVYGVTFIGAMRQVKKQLEAHYPEMVRTSGSFSGICSAYIARKIFNALGSIFTGAHHIQFWLGDCATRISSSLTPEQVQVICDKTESTKAKENSKIMKSLKKTPERHFRSGVTWTTPLNLTVVQPYRQIESVTISTPFQQVSIKDPQESDTIDKRRQLQAFPPNFVHSLDATHMILSALRCDAVGLQFSAVHDSFWTHAACINEMNRLLRDAFVQMHSEDVIGRLATEFDLRYSRHVFRGSIRGGDNPLRKKVEAWRRQYRKVNNVDNVADQSLEELKLEVKRQELLRSTDPKERQLGANMVTPGSIYDELDGEQYLQTQKSLGETALGHIPETAPQDIINSALDPETTDPNTNVDVEASIAPILAHDAPANAASAQSLPESHVSTSTPTDRDDVLSTLGFSKDKILTEEETLLVEMLEEARAEITANEQKKNAAKGKSSHPLYIWLPLRFAKVPKRGEWDVKRLKESDYFFS